MEIAEDSMAGPDDRRRFPLDEVTVRVTIASEDRVDDRAFIATIVRAGG